MIDFEHVTKVYETQNDENVALEDINIHIDEGEFVFILGHSGAGKSTFLKLIQMEEKPTEGKIYINDQDLTTIKRRKVPYLRRQMGAVFQDFRLIPTMTVYENVAFAMRVTNINNKTIKNRVPFALSLVGLEDKMDRLPDELSGGEQQRVAVARALAHHRVEIAVLVRQAGAVGQRTPLHVLPLAGDDEVQADVQSRIFFQHLDGFRIPGCYGHHFHAAGNTRAVGLDAGFVDGMQGTEIVNADDKCRGAGLSPYRQCSCCEQASGNHVFQS